MTSRATGFKYQTFVAPTNLFAFDGRHERVFVDKTEFIVSGGLIGVGESRRFNFSTVTRHLRRCANHLISIYVMRQQLSQRH